MGVYIEADVYLECIHGLRSVQRTKVGARAGLEFCRVGSRISGAARALGIGADLWWENWLRAGILRGFIRTLTLTGKSVHCPHHFAS